MTSGTNPYHNPLLTEPSDRISVATLAKNIRFVAESLAKHIYGQQTRDLLIFEGDLAINELFLTAWLDVLTAAPRAAPYLSKKSPLFSGLTQVSCFAPMGVTKK